MTWQPPARSTPRPSPGAHPAGQASVTTYDPAYRPELAQASPTGRPLLRSWLLGGVLSIGFLLIALVISAYYGATFGVSTTLLGAASALVPLLIVVPTFLWLDRFEAEPTRYLVVAFLWGALVAAAVAATLNTSAMLVLQATAGAEQAQAATAVFVAPVVEEGAKGLLVLLILLVRRREFDGITDGMVYAGITAAGFAFTENVQYLASAYLTGGEQALAGTFVARCLFSPFAHPMFTVLTGIGLGMASVSRSWLVRLGAPVVGYLLAVLAHGLWNLAAVLGAQGLVLIYLGVEVPIFLGFLAMVVLVRAREGRLIGRYLMPYAAAGWLTPAEIGMLSSMPRRREARVWAKANGGASTLRAMQGMQDAASELALLRQRMTHRAADQQALHTERVLLDTLMAHRSRLSAPSTPGLTRQAPAR